MITKNIVSSATLWWCSVQSSLFCSQFTQTVPLCSEWNHRRESKLNSGGTKNPCPRMDQSSSYKVRCMNWYNGPVVSSMCSYHLNTDFNRLKVIVHVGTENLKYTRELVRL